MDAKRKLALAMAHQCVRDTEVENWHSEGRISQAEMKAWMIDVADRLYTVVANLGDEQFASGLEILSAETVVMWKKPTINHRLVEACFLAAARMER